MILEASRNRGISEDVLHRDASTLRKVFREGGREATREQKQKQKERERKSKLVNRKIVISIGLLILRFVPRRSCFLAIVLHIDIPGRLP